jgi:hypothetical protein
MAQAQSDLIGIELSLLFREFLLIGKVLEKLAALYVKCELLMNCMMKYSLLEVWKA